MDRVVIAFPAIERRAMTKRSFNELTYSDSFMFAAIMEDEDICREVLERTLGIPIRKVKTRAEAALFLNSDYRSVRLDVLAEEEDGSKFEVEMQTTDKHNLPKRSRVYQGQMDLASLKPGTDFNELPKSVIIFICTYDPFGQKRYRYTFTPRCHETGSELGDETYRIFLSTKGENDAEVPPELVSFLKYVENASYADENPTDTLIQKISAKIKALKRDRGMEVQYMLFSEMLSDERKEGRKEGRTEGQNQLLQLMDRMQDGGDGDKILLLGKDPVLLRDMYDKYHIEA